MQGAMIALVTFLVGCGGGSSEDTVAADATFTSLDDIVAFYDERTAEGQTNAAAELMARVHAETPVQEDIVAAVREMQPMNELDQAVRERFDAPLTQGGEQGFGTASSPLQITESGDDRAQATTTGPDGTDATIHFVRVGEEWWISGYTFEYPMQEDLPPGAEVSDMVEMMQGMAGTMSSVATDLQRRLDAGEFSSVEEVRTAMNAAITAAMMQGG